MFRSDVAVATDQLTKHFGDLVAVDRLEFEVPTGTVASLLGPNGAGKTTVVRMLATLARPTAGTATVGGYDVRRDPDSVRQVIALTGQFAALEPNLTARENLLLVTRLRGHGRLAARRVVDRLIDQFDIGEFAGALVKKVSGGQRRRVDLAASLVLEPELLVLDEPTTGLDPRSRQVVWATVRELVGRGVTVLLTTQYLEEADELADQIVVMDHGRAVASGTPAELKAQIGGQRVDVVAFDDDAFRRLAAAFDGRFTASVVPERRLLSVSAPRESLDLLEVSRIIAEAQISVEEVALRRPTLDDTFLALTGHAGEQSPVERVFEEVPA